MLENNNIDEPLLSDDHPSWVTMEKSDLEDGEQSWNRRLLSAATQEKKVDDDSGVDKLIILMRLGNLGAAGLLIFVSVRCLCSSSFCFIYLVFLTSHEIVLSTTDLDSEYNKYLSILIMCSRRIWSLLRFSYLLLGNEFINVASFYCGKFWIFIQSFTTLNVLRLDGNGGLVI